MKVACGIDHTIVLIGAAIPSFQSQESTENKTNDESISDIQSFSPPSLKYLCELSIAKSSNLRNILSVLNASKYFQCLNLYSFAMKFILWY